MKMMILIISRVDALVLFHLVLVSFSTGIGGVLRDKHGEWILGFYRSIGNCLVLLTELWAIHDTLHYLWTLGYRKTVVKSDSLEVVRIILSNSNALSDHALVFAIG
ncbi:hypothetical protein V6N11_080591 [Hibiscus sabdariffa]|uniref:RNase H type-1 domain-containing protein n=1 Tax=Hibiscus sabdariffa TaxID=183260 RepID=A0ABR2R871_9ROSI